MRQMMVESMMKPNAVGLQTTGESSTGLMQTKPSSGYDMMNKDERRPTRTCSFQMLREASG